VVLGVTAPQRILRLQRRDRMDGVRPADRRRRRLGQSEEAHLAFLDERGHRADRLLDRRPRIDAVLIVEVDRLDAQTRQARLASGTNVVGLAADAETATVCAAL